MREVQKLHEKWLRIKDRLGIVEPEAVELAEKVLEVMYSTRFEPVLRADRKRSIEEAARRSRVWYWILNSKGFASITAWKDSLSKKENMKRNAKLLVLLRRKGLGVINIEGVGQSETGASIERGFFVYIPPDSDMEFGEFHRYIRKLAKMFDQFAYVIGKDGGKDIRLYVRDGNTYKLDQKWDHTTFRPEYLMPDQEGNLYYSKVKGQVFQFKKQVRESRGQGYFTGLALSSYLRKFKEKFGFSLR